MSETPFWRAIAPHVYLFQGAGHFNVNSLVLEADDHCILIDTQLEDANNHALLAAIRQQFPAKPIKTILISHCHLDHYLGLAWFREVWPEAEIIGVADARRQMDASTAVIWESYERLSAVRRLTRESIIYPTRAVAAPFELRFAGGTMQCQLAGPNEAWATMYGYLPASRTLYASDLFFGGIYIDPRIGGTLLGWSAASAALLHVPCERVIAGHSTSLHTPDELATFVERMQRLVRISRELVAQGVTVEEFIAYPFPSDIVIYAPQFSLRNIYHELRAAQD